MINGDGSRRSGVQLTFPNNDDEYAVYAQPAVVAGQLHLFGGMTIDRFSEYRKVIKQSFYIFYLNKIFSQIARLDGCAIVELSARLTSSSSGSHAALAIEDGSKGSRFSNQFFLFFKALICFGDTSPHTNCDVFDGSTVVETFSSGYPHRYAGLGFYNNQPTTVGDMYSEGAGKVETLGPNGWTRLSDQQT